MLGIDPLLALGVVVATAATDAVYVMFTSAVVARRRVPAATWSSIWYVLSSFAVISYTNNWVYVIFAAVGSWLGAYATMTFLHGPPSHPPAPLKPSPAGDPEIQCVTEGRSAHRRGPGSSGSNDVQSNCRSFFCASRSTTSSARTTEAHDQSTVAQRCRALTPASIGNTIISTHRRCPV